MPRIERLLASPGASLPPAAAERFAPVLGPAVASVRVHVGAEAAAATRSMGTPAFTMGEHLAFASGLPSAESSEGEHLLAHELAHVVQQQEGPPRLRAWSMRAVLEGVQRYWQAPLWTELEYLERRNILHQNDNEIVALRAMIALAEAIQSGDAPAARAATGDAIAKLRKARSLFGSADSIARELVARTFLMGLRDESRRLRAYFLESDRDRLEIRSPADFEQHNRSLTEYIVESAIARGSTASGESAESGIELLLATFNGLIAEKLYSIDLLQRLTVKVLETFQVMIDAVADDLRTGRGTDRLDRARKVLNDRIARVLGPFFDQTLEITKTDSDFGLGDVWRHYDYFEGVKPGSPNVVIRPYDRMAQVEEKSLTVKRILEIRRDQLDFLENLYGFGRDDQRRPIPESQENARAIPAGGLHLHSNDDWRRFLLNKFMLARGRHRAADPDSPEADPKALSETIALLRRYLKVYTIHTPNNIDDFGDEYLSKTFPRALTGQLIHDCGVYALRVAYMLSLVRKEADLAFRAIVLPAHVGLIITFEHRKGPVFIVHNDAIIELSEDEFDGLLEHWNDATQREVPPLRVRGLPPKEFLGDLAAGTFIDHVDMPYRLENVPQVPEVRDARKRHVKLWRFYRRRIVNRGVLRSTHQVEQPELQYLALLEEERERHDTLMVPFFRKAHELWREFVKKHAAIRPGAGRQAAEGALIRAHWEELWRTSQAWRHAIVKARIERDRVSALLSDHPDIVERGATVSRWSRLGDETILREEYQFWTYMGWPKPRQQGEGESAAEAREKAEAMRTSELLRAGAAAKPPWAVEKEKLPEPFD